MKKSLLAMMICCLAGLAQAATVYLKDGTQYSGTIVSATAQDIEVHTASGMVHVPSNLILRIDYSQAEPAAPVAAPASQEPSPPPAPRPRRVMRRWQPPRPDFEQERNEFSLDLGLGDPLSSVDFSSIGGGSDQNGVTGILVGAQYIHYLTPHLGLGLDFNYFNRGALESQSLAPNANTELDGDSLVFLGALKYKFLVDGPLQPYLMGGLGTHRTSTVINVTPDEGFSWSDTGTTETRGLVNDSSWGFASMLKMGFEFHYVEPFFFSLELGWMGLSNSNFRPTPAGEALGLGRFSGPLDVFTFAGRWGWRF